MSTRGPTLRSGRAFSLVELLAALALASVLMVAVMQVTASLGRMGGAMERRGDAGSLWRSDVRDLLRSELEQAMFAVADVDELHLEGMIGLGGASRDPVLVAYRLIRLDDNEPGLLVREQRRLLDRTSRPDRRDLVVANVRRFEPELLEPGERPAEAPRGGRQGIRRRLGRLVIQVVGEPTLVIEQELP